MRAVKFIKASWRRKTWSRALSCLRATSKGWCLGSKCVVVLFRTCPLSSNSQLVVSLETWTPSRIAALSPWSSTFQTKLWVMVTKTWVKIMGYWWGELSQSCMTSHRWGNMRLQTFTRISSWQAGLLFTHCRNLTKKRRSRWRGWSGLSTL